jgi:hypothetical protein
MTERYFQVYNESTHRWILFDRTMGRMIDMRKDEKPYRNTPMYKEEIK